MSISMPRKRFPWISNLLNNKNVGEKKFIIDTEEVPKKTIYEKIKYLELEIESRLGGLELTNIEPNKLETFKEQYKILKEETNKQIKREETKNNIELYLKDSNYYQRTLNEFLEQVDATLVKYTFFKRIKEFKIEENINISIKEILDLRCDYICLNILFNDNEKNWIDEYLSNIYFEIIVKEMKSMDDSSLFKELSLIEKKKVQLVLIDKIRENISKTKFRKEHLDELTNIIFSLDNFRMYFKIMKKYGYHEVRLIGSISDSIVKDKVKIK